MNFPRKYTRKSQGEKVTNFSLWSCYLTICGAVLFVLARVAYATDNEAAALFLFISLIIFVVAALFFSIVGINQKNMPYKYLSVSVYLLLIIFWCMTFFDLVPTGI
jgi:hypothetical protein